MHINAYFITSHTKGIQTLFKYSINYYFITSAKIYHRLSHKSKIKHQNIHLCSYKVQCTVGQMTDIYTFVYIPFCTHSESIHNMMLMPLVVQSRKASIQSFDGRSNPRILDQADGEVVQELVTRHIPLGMQLFLYAVPRLLQLEECFLLSVPEQKTLFQPHPPV